MKIYPDGHPWRPLNGSETEKFAQKYCDICVKDNEGCNLPYRILSGEIIDNSPWVYQKGEPHCNELQKYIDTPY